MPLTTSLISYWKLDEASGNATDSHGSNTLTDNNTVTSTTGKINTARSFAAASSEYFSIADNASLSTGDVDFTIAAWVNLTSKGAERYIACKGNDEWGLTYDTTNDRFRFWAYGAASYQEVFANTLGSPSASTWYYIIAEHNASANTISIQVNNGGIDTRNSTTGPADLTGPFTIGSYQSGAAYWNGAIDEVAFWKRTLTTQERTDLYNGGSGLAYPLTPATVNPFPAWLGMRQVFEEEFEYLNY